MNPGALDLNVCAILIAERMVGEILGWDLVDWSVVERHKESKGAFGRGRQSDPSIYHQLKPIFDRCNSDRKDFSALRPSPLVNANLSKLVGYLCRHIGGHELTGAKMTRLTLERTAEQDQLHLIVVDHLLRRIEADPGLGARALCLKRIAAAAESELEKHFADLISERLERSFLPGGDLDARKIGELRDRARSYAVERRALNEQELAGLSVPDLLLDDEALVRIEMAKILLSRFPYVRNYELMLLAELAMLQQPFAPLFVRERMLVGKGRAIDAAQLERFDHAIAGIAAYLGPDRRSRQSLLSHEEGRTIAICGSGPLPLSALFLHLFTGAAIILIDEDPAAVERSKRLIANLERLEILAPNALTSYQQNAERLSFLSPGTPVDAPFGDAIVCDAVMIASLVDADAKASIAAQFKDNPKAPDLLIMRSATGLSAKLAYDPLPTESFSCGCLAFCGETLPATQVSTHLDRTNAALRQVASLESPGVLAIAHPDVLNTTEVYRKLPPPMADISKGLAASATIEDWIGELEAAGRALRSAGPHR